MSMTLLIGAARSGKSDLAVRMGHAWGAGVTFIATAEGRDEEMAERIGHHRARRPESWRTVEEPIHIRNEITASPEGDLVIVDCLTLWVSNLLEHGPDGPRIESTALEAAKVGAARHSPVVVVSNEVGAGIVPMEASVRAYRDLLGSVNRIFAEHAARVLLMSVGRAIALQPVEEVVPDLLGR